VFCSLIRNLYKEASATWFAIAYRWLQIKMIITTLRPFPKISPVDAGLRFLVGASIICYGGFIAPYPYLVIPMLNKMKLK